MKWVEGESLFHLLERLRKGDEEAHQTWDFDARTRLFMEICRGIAHAHERGILHRDIKPGNIMVARDGSVQIVDWGLAKAQGLEELPAEGTPVPADSLTTRAGVVFGTPAYMSPEQARGEPYTEHSEVFSLGVLFWEMLTLRSPRYRNLSGKKMVEFAKTRVLPVPFHVRPHPVQGPVPSHLSWFVHRAVRPHPDDRFASVEAMMDALRERAHGMFPVQCPATFQRRVLMRLTHLLDRYPNHFPVAVVGSILAVAASLVLLGVWLG